jgi:hypothetical protein
VACGVILFTTLLMTVKLRHGLAVAKPVPGTEFSFGAPRDPLITLGRWWLDPLYATNDLPRSLTAAENAGATRVSLPVVATPDHFGRAGVAYVQMAQAGWCVPNIVVFPWSIVKVSGKIVPREQLAHWKHLYAIQLPAGPSDIEWDWEPNRLWVVLNSISRWTLIAALAGTAIWGWRVGRATAPR